MSKDAQRYRKTYSFYRAQPVMQTLSPSIVEGSSIFTTINSPNLEANTVYSVSFDPSVRYPADVGSDVFFFVAGDDSQRAVFEGTIKTSGSLVVGRNAISHFNGEASIAQGSAIAIGPRSVALGAAYSVGTYSHAFGHESLAFGYNSQTGGQGVIATSDGSLAQGYQTLAGAELHGFTITAGDTVATILGEHAGVTDFYVGDTVLIVPLDGMNPPTSSYENQIDNIQRVGGNLQITLHSPIDQSTTFGFIVDTQVGRYSHAEGERTLTRGIGSHAEGKATVATGSYSHSEGLDTVAYGDYSHAGGIGTVASGSGQTVFGTYNINNNQQSLFIIGNGTHDPITGDSRSDVLRVESTGLQVTGSFSVSGSLFIANGNNLPAGTAILNGGSPGTVTVNNTLVKSDSIILLTKQTFNNTGVVAVSGRTAGSSFTITSSANGDTDKVGYLIINNG